MAVYKQPKSKYWWFKFVWNGKTIRESTRQTNKRVAEQMEAARRTQLAKGEVGIRDVVRIPTLAEFAEERFRPFIRATFAAKPKTQRYYENGLNNLLAFEKLALQPLDEITSELIAAYVATRHAAKLEISSINRELQVLRRMSYDVTTILVDCALRPEECFRPKPVHVQHGNVEIPFGKTENATRKIPMTSRVEAIVAARNK
jgi:hypothetical protein